MPPAIDRFASEAAHAILGCAAGAASAGINGGSGGSGCSAGAVGAVVGHLAGQAFNPYADPAYAGQTISIGKLMGAIAGAIATGTAEGAFIGGAAGANAVENNYLAHVHKALSWNAARAAGLSVLESDLLSAAVVLIDFQGPHLGSDGLTFDAQDVEHSHMHAMCAAGSSTAVCELRIADYKQKLRDMKSVAGLAGLLHMYQDGFATGHANLHEYDGSISLEHRGGLGPLIRTWRSNTAGSAQIIRDYANNCQCIISRH